jgi:predicted nucleic acid-binding Zn ribbon protein
MSKSRPQPIADVLAELMSRRGYGRERSGQQWEEVWRAAAGPLVADNTRVGTVRRGKLEIIVANSTLMQELTFQKTAILDRLREELPGETIVDLRMRVGAIQ